MSRRNRESEQKFEDLSSYSSSREYHKRRKTRRGPLAAKIALAVVSVLLILVGSVMIYISTDLLAALTTNNITKDPRELGIDGNNVVMDESIKNIALFGVDSRNDSFTGLSDVIMILTVDNKHRKVKMTSILRDTKVHIEGEMLDGDYMDWDTKINNAYYYGGPELAIRTLNRNFGLDITDYVTVNFANMAAIVDAFGGVDIAVTAEETREINRNLWALSQEVLDQMEADREEGTYSDHRYSEIVREDFIPDASGELDVNSGNYVASTLHLNGNQAVAYSRIRNVGDDYERAERQHKVMAALIGSIEHKSFSDYPGLIKQMMPYCETSLGLADIVGLTPILTGDFEISSIKIPDPACETDLYDGPAEDNINYLTFDLTQASKRISSFIFEELSPYWNEYGGKVNNSELGE